MTAVFIGGAERSGTTLAASLLGGHSDLVTVPESQFVVEALVQGLSGSELSRFLSRHWRLGVWELEDLVVPEDSQLSVRQAFMHLASQYAKSGSAPFENSRCIVDHTPWNMKWAPILSGEFRDARFIHVVRDGRAVAASLKKVTWGPRTVRGAAYYWVREIGFGLGMERLLGTERVLQIRFERLVREPQAELSRMCTFLGLEFEEEMVEGTGFTPPRYTASQHALVGQRPVAGRSDAWKQALTSNEVAAFEEVAGPLLQALGYSLNAGPGHHASLGKLVQMPVGAAIVEAVGGFVARARGRLRRLSVRR